MKLGRVGFLGPGKKFGLYFKYDERASNVGMMCSNSCVVKSNLFCWIGDKGTRGRARVTAGILVSDNHGLAKGFRS